jgi:hypothetical protein
VQIAFRLVSSTVPRLFENNNDPVIVQLTLPVERVQILWETHPEAHKTKGKIASQTTIFLSSSPI